MMAAESPSVTAPDPISPPSKSRWNTAGKFFRDGATGDAVFLKAITWGPFPPGEEPDPDVDLPRVRDQLGANALRVFEVPDREFLDRCDREGLRVFLTYPWSHHIDFLADRRTFFEVREQFRRTVRELRGHPAIAGWMVANEIPAPLVRWMGPRRVNRALEQLIASGREGDPEALFSYANYPSTEYLCPRGQDFLSFNVYLEDRDAYSRYLRRLQQQAGDLPLLISEFGLDSRSHGEETQAEVLAWHVEETARSGAAGTTLFAWSDRWYRGGEIIRDWEFGMVRRDGSAKPALDRVGQVWSKWTGPADALAEDFPRPPMSLIVCTYRGARLLRPCLASLRKLRYPDYEVIVVNDGDDAEVAQVAEDFPEVRLVPQNPHGGLSAARNLGARSARGEILVYTDDDCEADPDWLTWLALAFDRDDLDAAGGPNIPPPPSTRIRAMVAAAPGGPAHVLLDDREAEHLPGCNLAVRREAFEAMEGFDPRFRVAGDDVDFCWRLHDAGFRLGFHPAAMVWHHRRFTPRAYLRQQLGYGRAEAKLMPIYPERFGLRGGARWEGRVYLESPAAILMTSGSRIYHGVRGHAPFQVLYGNGSAHSPAAMLLDWTWISVAIALVAIGGFSGFTIPAIAGGLMLMGSLVRAIIQTRRASLLPRYDDLPSRIGVTLLTLIQGPVRSFRRFLGVPALQRSAARSESSALPDRSSEDAPEEKVPWYLEPLPFPLSRRTQSFWSESGADREAWLAAFEEEADLAGWPIREGKHHEPWDLTIGNPGRNHYRIITVTEYHESGRTLTRIRCTHHLLIGSWLAGFLGGGSPATRGEVKRQIRSTAERIGLTPLVE